MKEIRFWMLAAIFSLCSVSALAQVMKAAALEKYAKERYGDMHNKATRWLCHETWGDGLSGAGQDPIN